MAIVIGFDIHRQQITYDALDDENGEVRRGRVTPADRAGLRRFLASLPPGEIDVALEATTGWRFVFEELVAAGMTPHLAEPAETSNLRGRKAHAKTDRGVDPLRLTPGAPCSPRSSCPPPGARQSTLPSS